MHTEKMRHQVHASIDYYCSSLTGDPNRVQRVLQDACVKMEKRAINKPRKCSVGAVIIIVLLILSITAVAGVAVYQYFQSAIKYEADYGVYQDWPLDMKLSFIELLVSEGVDLGMDKVAQLHDEQISKEMQNSLADDIVTSYFGEGHDDFLSAVNMMEKEKGQFSTWSLEEKAWVSEAEEKAGSIRTDYEMHRIPGERDVSPDQALQIAQSILMKQYDLTADEIALWKHTIDFFSVQFDNGFSSAHNETIYQIAFYSEFSDIHPYFVTLSNTGEYISASEPFGINKSINQVIKDMMDPFVTVEDKARFAQEVSPFILTAIKNEENVNAYYTYLAHIPYIAYSEEYLNERKATAIAEHALVSHFGWPKEQVALYHPWISLREERADRVTDASHSVQENAVWYFKYKYMQTREIDAMYRNGEIPWGAIVVIDAVTGEVKEIRYLEESHPFSYLSE